MIISAVVGAGFATGAELVAFFGASALPPIWIAVLVGVFLFLFMAALLYLPMRFGKRAFVPVFFIFFTAMTAGVTELAGPITALVAVVTSILVVWIGFERMLAANKLLMGFALAVLLVVVLMNVGGALPQTGNRADTLMTTGKALLYAGMNCCLLPGIFARARQTLSRRDLLICAAVSTVVISFFVMVILTAIHVRGAAGAPMPIFAIADSAVVRFAVLVCILTSMFAALFNLGAEIPRGVLPLAVVGALGFLFSFLGFTKVIGIFYPIVGMVMIGFIIFSFCCWLRLRFVGRRSRGRQSRRA